MALMSRSSFLQGRLRRCGERATVTCCSQWLQIKRPCMCFMWDYAVDVGEREAVLPVRMIFTPRNNNTVEFFLCGLFRFASRRFCSLGSEARGSCWPQGGAMQQMFQGLRKKRKPIGQLECDDLFIQPPKRPRWASQQLGSVMWNQIDLGSICCMSAKTTVYIFYLHDFIIIFSTL